MKWKHFLPPIPTIHHYIRTFFCAIRNLIRATTKVLARIRPERGKNSHNNITYKSIWSINQPKGPTTKDPPSEKLPHGDNFRVGPKSDRTQRDNTVDWWRGKHFSICVLNLCRYVQGRSCHCPIEMHHHLLESEEASCSSGLMTRNESHNKKLLLFNSEKQKRIAHPSRDMETYGAVELLLTCCSTHGHYAACIIPILHGTNYALSLISRSPGQFAQDKALIWRKNPLDFAWLTLSCWFSWRQGRWSVAASPPAPAWSS